MSHSREESAVRGLDEEVSRGVRGFDSLLMVLVLVLLDSV